MLQQLDPEFLERLEKHYSPEEMERIHQLPSGLCVLLREDKGGAAMIGCSACFQQPVKQDAMGYPTLQGKPCLRLEDVSSELNQNVGDGISPEIVANTWMCPYCKSLLRGLLPRFQPPTA